MDNLETTKRLCLRNKRLRKFFGRDDIKCYNHKIHGWIIFADNIFHCEDGREMPLEEIKKVATLIDSTRKNNWSFLQEIFYLRIIKKDLSQEQLLEEHQRILDWQKRNEKANLDFIIKARQSLI